MPTVSDIVEELEAIAPPELAEDDDRIGLQVGAFHSEARKLCVTVDTSPATVARAIESKADLLVAHHPLIYQPLTSMVEASPVPIQVAELIRAGVSLYVMHTNYDVVPGGINDVLAQVLGVRDCQPLTISKQDKFYKIVVFVPEEAVERVRNAMADAGAGRIGQYTHCSFRAQGIGSFVPLPAAQPYIGSTGRLEEVEEYRLEMVCVGSWLDITIAEMLDKHPYDEVAYDVYELANDPISYGLGRVGTLDNEIALSEFADSVNSALHPAYLKVHGDVGKPVRRVALCGGGGSSLYRDAARAGADVFVTGDTKHHDVLDANALGLAVIDAGHFDTERPGMIALSERLKKSLADRAVEVEFIQ